MWKTVAIKVTRYKKQYQILLSLRKKKEKSDRRSLTGVFSDKVIDFTDESSMWCSFVKNSFVEEADIQLVTNRSDRNTYCIVSESNFVYNFGFLTNWRIQFLFIHLCLCFIDLITPKSSNLQQKIYKTLLWMTCWI